MNSLRGDHGMMGAITKTAIASVAVVAVFVGWLAALYTWPLAGLSATAGACVAIMVRGFYDDFKETS